MSEPATSRPVGRPSAYDPKFCDEVRTLATEGMSRAEIAAELGVARQTLTNWGEAHPEFLAALHEAHDLSLAWWEKQARTNLATTGYQAGLWKQAMSGRFPAEPYRDRTEADVNARVAVAKIENVIVDPANTSDPHS